MRYAVIQGYNCRESVALTSGTKLGPYEIVEPLGAGGMGEVYRARDTRLGRDVAIKVLPSHLSSDANLKVRFEREARAISSLSHPNICTLHDVGSQNGVDFLVMEYLEGETLQRRLLRGAMPLKQVLEYGIQILHRSHRSAFQGHRDNGQLCTCPQRGHRSSDPGPSFAAA